MVHELRTGSGENQGVKNLLHPVCPEILSRSIRFGISATNVESNKKRT